MPDKDDQDWMSALAGKPRADGDAVTLAEANAVREAISEIQRQQPLPDFDETSGLQRLLFRLRELRLLESAPGRRSWRVYTALAMAACLVLAIGIVLLQLPEQPPDQVVFRGGPGEPQVIENRDPAKLVQAMTADLQSLGIAPETTQFGGTITLEADWPQKPDAGHLRFLQRYKLAQPAAARLRVEVRQRG